MTQTNQPGLFAQLEPLLAHRAVLITVAQLEGDQLQVNICPRQLKESENQALTIPLSVTGTAAELDADLVLQVASFVASHVGLHTNLTAIEKEIAEAEKVAREEAKKKAKVIGNGGKKAAETSSTKPQAPPVAVAAKPEPEPLRPLNLFDQPNESASE
ncbi:MAG: PRTRC system protein E [Acidobacteria bacterium]|nr:PRTRC system protein E [Acidobacteriota bacterium]